MCHRMLADAEYFNSRISRLDGAGDLGEHVVNVVRAKAIIGETGATKKPAIEKPQTEQEQEAPKPTPATETQAT